MKHIFYFILLSVFCSSCACYKSINVVQDYLNSKEKDSLFNKKREFLNIDYNIKYVSLNIVPTPSISDFLYWKEENSPKYSCSSFWIDKTKKFVLSKEEIDKIKLELNQLKEEVWSNSDFDSASNIKVEDFRKVYLNKQHNSTNIYYEMSNAFFLKKNKRKFAFIYVSPDLQPISLDKDSKMIIMEYFNKKWNFIGEIYRK